MSLVKSSALIGALTFASRILGFAREALTARYLGAGWISDCFFVAFKLPNLFRRLFAEGAFSASFVPIVSRIIGRSGGDTAPARTFAEDTLGLFMIVLMGFSALAMIFMPAVVVAMTGGFKDPEPGQIALAVELSRITFPYLMLISLVSLLGGVLNSLGRFGAAAASPILLNVCMIGALLLVNQEEIAAARAISVGVAVAGIAQLAWLIWACDRAGISIRLRMPRLTPDVRQLGRTMLPAILGQGAMQINLLVDTFLATRFLAAGSLSYIYYADRLNQLPLGVIGIAVGTALLPTISRQLGAQDAAAANVTQNRGIELALLFALPAALALIALAEPIVRLSYERGQFGGDDTHATALALIAFACGLPAYILIKVLTPGYFARGDTATPVKIAIIAMVANFVLNISLIWSFKHVGLAASTAAAAWLNAGLLYWGLKHRDHFSADRRLITNTVKITLAATVMACAAAVAAWGASAWLAEQGLMLALALMAIIATAMVIYFGLIAVLGVVPLSDIARRIRRRSATQ